MEEANGKAGAAPEGWSKRKKIIAAVIVLGVLETCVAVAYVMAMSSPFWVADKSALSYEKVDAEVWLASSKKSGAQLMFKAVAEPGKEGRLTCFEKEGADDVSTNSCPLAQDFKRGNRKDVGRAELEVAKVDYGWISWAMPDLYVLKSHRMTSN